MPEILLKIIVNEQQHDKRDAICKKVLAYLREQGAPGATMRRGEAGLDYRGNVSYDLLEDTYFNDLPIIIESVMDKTAAERLDGDCARWLRTDKSAEYRESIRTIMGFTRILL
jgi:PII-like signaling protein